MITSTSPDSTRFTTSFCSFDERKRDNSSTLTGNGAKRVLADLRNVLQNCGSWQSTPEPGRTVDYTVSKIEKGKLPGDDAVAVRVRSSNVFGNIEVRRSTVAVMTRRGPVVDLVMQTANVGLDQPAAPVLDLAARADRRLATSG